MEQEPGEMVAQFGRLELLSAPDASPAAQSMAQEPTLPQNCSVWDLITGPEATHWSRLLISSHLDSSARFNLNGTCTAARDRVLATAQRMTFQLQALDGIPSESKLLAGRKALLTRGKLPTKLLLSTSNSVQLSYALTLLGDSTTWLDEIHLRCGRALYASVLGSIGCGCRNLRSLTIIAPPHELPSPELFPKLKELAIRTVQQPGHSNSDTDLQRSSQSLAPYIKQLTLLSIHSTAVSLSTVVSPESRGSHLRTLHLNTDLDSTLLGLILQCAPTLEQLAVQQVQVQPPAVHSGMHTQWRQLRCSRLYLSSLAYLPHAPGMHLILSSASQATLFCDTTSLTHEAIAARLKEIRFSISTRLRVSISASEGGDVSDQPAALRLGLSLLRSRPMAASTAPGIELQAWTMSAPVMQELAALPSWGPALQYHGVVWLPEPTLYSALLSQLPNSYSNVIIKANQLTSEQVESICLGAPRSRAAEAPLQIRLWYCDVELLQAIQLKMQAAGMLPQVTVSG